MRFVPGSSRAKRVSLGALAALTVAPAAGLADGTATTAPARRQPGTGDHHRTRIVLSEGSEGRQVELLQKALGGVKVDGVFGPETEAAVAAFQASRALTVDGVVGPATAAALRGEAAARALTTGVNAALPGEASTQRRQRPRGDLHGHHHRTRRLAGNDRIGRDPGCARANPHQHLPSAASVQAPAASAGAASEPTTTGTPEKPEEDAVGRLQSALRLTADSDFGPETEAAIRRLQARHGLTVDGVVGPATWAVLGVHGAETLTPPPDALPKPHRHHQASAAAAAVDVSDTAGSEAEAPASSEAPARRCGGTAAVRAEDAGGRRIRP